MSEHKFLLKGSLRKLADERVMRIKSGLFNVFFIYGETRSGKSTVARKMAYYMAKELGVPFNVKDNVHFSVEKLGEACEGAKWGVFILDEASNDLLASDRSNMFQTYLRKYFNTAAKFNQTFFILMPHLGQCKKDFLLSRHVFGIKTYFYYNKDAKTDEERWLKGKGVAFNYLDLLEQLDHYNGKRYKAYMHYYGDGRDITFDSKEPYMTTSEWDLYEQKKDESISDMIQSYQKDEEEPPKKKKYIKKEEIDYNREIGY